MIDIQKIAQTLGFEEDEIHMLLEMFLEGAYTSLENLSTAIRHKDYEQIKLEAHSIKGSAANLMLDDIYQLAKEIEDAGKQKSDIDYDADYATLQALLDSLKTPEMT